MFSYLGSMAEEYGRTKRGSDEEVTLTANGLSKHFEAMGMWQDAEMFERLILRRPSHASHLGGGPVPGLAPINLSIGTLLNCPSLGPQRDIPVETVCETSNLRASGDTAQNEDLILVLVVEVTQDSRGVLAPSAAPAWINQSLTPLSLLSARRPRS